MLQPDFGLHRDIVCLWRFTKAGFIVDYHWCHVRFLRRHERPTAACIIAYRQGLDSLADDVTFGVAPATIVFSQLYVMEYPSFLESLRPVLPYAAFIIAAFSALRLAKFNLDERQSTSFIGVPTPANALFWGSLIVFNPEWLTVHSWSLFIILALILITSYLLVCELPLFALKFKQWSFKGNEVKYVFIAFTVIVLALAIVSEGAIGFLQAWWLIILVYVLTSLFLFLKKKK